ncbi:hypothetical protein BDF22DRAFT_732178 [Syncephalis plumigaleata]|nr:hypothetical protein BDF22DRAFT_732178 [Syncephalis plumigaleata]
MASQPGTNGSSTSADSERVLAVKSSLSGIGWKKHHDVLRDFVNIVHTTTFHAYSLLKYIFLEQQHNRHFDMEKYIRVDFFKEVWLSLIKPKKAHGLKRKQVDIARSSTTMLELTLSILAIKSQSWPMLINQHLRGKEDVRRLHQQRPIAFW